MSAVRVMPALGCDLVPVGDAGEIAAVVGVAVGPVAAVEVGLRRGR